MSTGRHAVFRVHAGPTVGGGHLARTLVLAAALRARGWRTTYAVEGEGLDLCRRMVPADTRAVALDAPAAGDAAAMMDAVGETCNLLVVDHYDLDAEYESACADWTDKTVVVDDLANRRHACDILVDPSPRRLARDYASLVPGHCVTFLGASYALLRAEFAAIRPGALMRRQENRPARRLVVSFGMSNPESALDAAVDALAECPPELNVDFVFGSPVDDGNDLRRRLAEAPQTINVHVSPDNLAQLMLAADLAIGAAGGSALERCCLGLPAVTISIAENQDGNLLALASLGAVLPVAAADGARAVARAVNDLVNDDGRRKRMALAAAGVCDGLGAARVMLALDPETCRTGESILSRPANSDDLDLMFRWQTAPGARRYSGKPDAPDWAEHCRWHEARLRPQPGLFEVVLKSGDPVGVIRLDRDENAEDAYWVSILITPEFQGEGIGRAALRIARRLFPAAAFHARIHPDNIASRKIFAACGYRPNGETFLSIPEAAA